MLNDRKQEEQVGSERGREVSACRKEFFSGWRISGCD